MVWGVHRTRTIERPQPSPAPMSMDQVDETEELAVSTAGASQRYPKRAAATQAAALMLSQKEELDTGSEEEEEDEDDDQDDQDDQDDEPLAKRQRTRTGPTLTDTSAPLSTMLSVFAKRGETTVFAGSRKKLPDRRRAENKVGESKADTTVQFAKLKPLPELKQYSRALKATLGDAAKLAEMERLYVRKLSRKYTQGYSANGNCVSSRNARIVWGQQLYPSLAISKTSDFASWMATVAEYCEALDVPIKNSKEEAESVKFLLETELLITELRMDALEGNDFGGGLEYVLPRACDAFDDSVSVQVLLNQRNISVTSYLDVAEHLQDAMKDRETHVKPDEVVTVGGLANR